MSRAARAAILQGVRSSGVLVRASATAPEFAPVLTTVPNIELLEVGEDWHTSTGDFTWDEGDLHSAVESQADPAVRSPVIKLGHIDPRFDGEPAFGRIENMYVGNNSQTLFGDLVGVPAWLAQIMPTAYPRRSIEGYFDYSFTDNKQKWPFILTGLALLGAMYPAITTLEDLPTLWGVEPPPMVEADKTVEIHATTTTGNHLRAMRVVDLGRHVQASTPPVDDATEVDDRIVPQEADEVKTKSNSKAEAAAATSMDDVRMAFYDSLDGTQMWWWIRQVLVNPLQLVVDDDEGGLYLVDVNVSGTDITFAGPQQVKVEYVAANLANLPKQGQIITASYGSATESPGAKVRATQENDEPEEEDNVKLSPDALAALGLQPDATEEQINAAIVAAKQAQATTSDKPEGDEPEGDKPAGEPSGSTDEPVTKPDEDGGEPDKTPDTSATDATGGPQAATVPDGAVVVDKAQWEEMRKGVAASQAIAEKQRVSERDAFIVAACQQGKFPRARVQHWTDAWEKDPEGTKAAIDSLAPGLIPIAERGNAGETDPTVAEAAYPDHWKPRNSAASASRVKVVND